MALGFNHIRRFFSDFLFVFLFAADSTGLIRIAVQDH